MTPVAGLDAARSAAALNAFTALFDDRPASGSGPFAGVPFAAKGLFDVTGRPTLAGSIINAGDPTAREDATAIARLEAGAGLVSLITMDEYAYGFATESAHTGATRNPHDPARIAGGSSGGSAAAGIVPLAPGSDTNGSVRVPASLCGVRGLKPTYGRLSRGGSFLFVAELDHVGAFARDLALLARGYDAMQGADPRDPAGTGRVDPIVPTLAPRWLRAGVLGGWFARGGTDDACDAVERAAATFDARPVERAGAEAAATLPVVYPHMTGIGGDGFWLVAEQDGRVHAFDACGRAGPGPGPGRRWRCTTAWLPCRGAAASLPAPSPAPCRAGRRG